MQAYITGLALFIVHLQIKKKIHRCYYHHPKKSKKKFGFGREPPPPVWKISKLFWVFFFKASLTPPYHSTIKYNNKITFTSTIYLKRLDCFNWSWAFSWLIRVASPGLQDFCDKWLSRNKLVWVILAPVIIHTRLN